MPTISSLFVELRLAADSFNNGLKQAQREAKEFEKDLKPTLTATKDLGIAMTVAGGAVVAAMTAATKAAVDYGDQLNDARQRTGATVETLAKLGFAAEQSGSSFEGLSTGLKFLSRNMESAIAKSGEQRGAFNALGISSKDLAAAQGDVNKVFLLLSDRFRELPDGAEKSALAMRIFGKSGTDLIPILNEGSAGITKLGDDAERAGLVISQDFASASDQLNDTLNEVKAAAMGASIGIAQALLPTLQDAATTTADLVKEFAEFTKQHPALVQASAALGAALLTVGTGLTAIAIIIPKVQAGLAMMGGAMNVLSGVAIIALVASLVALYKAYTDAEEAQNNLNRALLDQQSSANKAARALNDHKISVDLAGKSEAEQAVAIAKAGKELQAKLLTTKQATDVARPHAAAVLDEAAAEKSHKEALEKSKKAAEELRAAIMAIQTPIGDWADAVHEYGDQWRSLYDVLKVTAPAINVAEYELAGFDETLKAVNASMEQARYNAEEMQKDFDSIMKTDPGMQIGKGIEVASKATKDLSEAFKDVKSTATKVFSDMFRDGEFQFGKLASTIKGIFTTLATELLSTMTAKLITPLINSLTGMLSKIPGIGGLFGGGAGAGGGAAAGAGAGGAGAGMAAFFTNPLTIGIGAAIAATTVWLKSQAHWEANKFVQSIQNPFGDALGDISDAFAEAEAAGSLTADAAEEARRQVTDLWESFQTQAKEFSSHGKDEAKVVEQAFAQLTPFMKQIFADMDKSVAKLKEQSGTAASAAGDAADYTTGSMQALANAAASAIDPVIGLANAIAAMASAAAGAGGGGTSSTGTSTPTTTTSGPYTNPGTTTVNTPIPGIKKIFGAPNALSAVSNNVASSVNIYVTSTASNIEQLAKDLTRAIKTNRYGLADAIGSV